MLLVESELPNVLAIGVHHVKDGRVIAAGHRRDVLTDAVLTDAYGLPVKLYEVADRFWPAVYDSVASDQADSVAGDTD